MRLTPGTEHGGFGATSEGLDQRGLLHSGFTADQDHAPVRGSRLAHVHLKLRQGLFALEFSTGLCFSVRHS